jgi:translation initiation factor eIF-2B subunit gamma
VLTATDITLICPPSAAEAITTALNINPFLTALPLPKPDLLAPKNLDQNTGTAEILRLPEVKSIISSDFIVLPCDLVCELGGEKLLQAWMVKAASISNILDESIHSNESQLQNSGGLGVWYETKTAAAVKGEETDFIATTSVTAPMVAAEKGSLIPNLSKLVYAMPTDSLNDLMEERKGLPIRHSLIRAHPRVRMLTTHRDAHIYILPKWVVEFVNDNDRLESIGEDVIGWWAKAGWQSGLAEKLKFKSTLGLNDDDEEDSQPEGNPSLRESVIKASGNSTIDVQGSDTRTSGKFAHNKVVPPILAYIHPSQPSAPLIRRVDTAQLLLAVSLQLAKLPSVEEAGVDGISPFAHARKVAYPEGVKSRTTITKQDSLLADNVTVEEKTSIKESVIGANCQINEGAKLSQCLLMEGVVVGKSCKLTRCILGKRCVIGDGSVLTDCEVQENLLVEAKSKQTSISNLAL